MTFQPIVPATGLVGWRYLDRTIDQQVNAFAATPSVRRDTDYFAERIGDVETAEQLVADRRLLRVALGAFGLQDDINSKSFIQRVLEGGSEDPKALASRLTDSRYADFARAFGFGNASGALTKNKDFAKNLIQNFNSVQFEIAIGDQDDDLRLALNLEREIGTLVDQSESETTSYYRILGSPPLRAVFERALALPSGFGQIDLDQQIETIRDGLYRKIGVSSLLEFGDSQNTERLVQRFFLQSQISEVSLAISSQSIALTLLSSAIVTNE